MNIESNKPIAARELTDKEQVGVVGGKEVMPGNDVMSSQADVGMIKPGIRPQTGFDCMK